jgi:hypothetical protein
MYSTAEGDDSTRLVSSRLVAALSGTSGETVGKKPLEAEEQSCGESYTVTTVISYGQLGHLARHQGTYLGKYYYY